MPRCGIRKSTQNSFSILTMPGDLFISCAYQGWETTSRLLFLPWIPQGWTRLLTSVTSVKYRRARRQQKIVGRAWISLLKWAERLRGTLFCGFCFLSNRLLTFKHYDLQSSTVLNFSFRLPPFLPHIEVFLMFSDMKNQTLKKSILLQSLGWDFSQIKFREFMVKSTYGKYAFLIS